MVNLIVLLLVVVLVVFPLWAVIRILALGKENNALAEHLREIQRELAELRDRLGSTPAASRAVPDEPRPAVPYSPPPVPAVFVAPPPAISAAPPVLPPVPARATTDAMPPAPLAPPPFVDTPAAVSLPAPLPAPPAAPARPRVNWEQFMGAKLFAWLGGLAAFLAVAFFVKYSFEHDLIPPEVRVAIGYMFALGLIVGGLKIPRPRYAGLTHTLCATGIVCLYAVTFACNSIYHFAFFGPLATFLLMSLVTTVAFLLAVRLEAHAVAILGMLGGFITPVLLSTGHDNPAGLFGYIALLDLGLIAVALHRRWHYLVGLGALGTVAMQVGWGTKFLNAAKAPTAMVVCLGFCALFLGAYFAARYFGRRHLTRTASEPDSAASASDSSPAPLVSTFFIGCAIAFPFVAFGFASVFLGYGTISARPGLLFSFIFAADLCLLVLAWRDEIVPKLHLIAGVAVFALLAAWTGGRLTADLLPWALSFYLVHAVLHTAFPLVLERVRPAAAPSTWSNLFPPLALLLMIVPLFKLEGLSLLFWPCVLLVDLLAIFLALLTASLAGVAMVLLLTLVVTGVWVLRVPATTDASGSLLLVIGGFAVLFFAVGMFLYRRFAPQASDAVTRGARVVGDARAQIPASACLLPFMLLILMTQRLPLANPSPLFGLGLLLVVLTLGLTVILAIEWLPACGLAGIVALEYAWRARHSTPDNAFITLTWYVVFTALFIVFPFLFRRRFAALTGPWAMSALAAVLHFPLVYQLVERVWPNERMGLLPALFALPPLLGLVAILRARPTEARARLNQLAWFGGVALFFVTLIFPIQFERQWITVGWALEGAALLWLFHRVPHGGLRATGVGLLVAAFARLALNPAVLEYHARSTTPVFNWYFYSYGTVTVCLFLGMRLLAPPRARVFGLHAPALLGTLGTVLVFLLLNLEIADFFTPAGARVLTFEFSGNFARDMTYTIAWALFALGLLLVSFWQHLRAGRYAALGLLGIALLKLFFHDLARLEALYRIGALLAVAIIAIVASFAYQRFLPGNEKHASDNT
jgi:uncharacterized membrane protein